MVFNSPEQRAKAAATRKANAEAIRGSKCRENCGRDATITMGAGRSMCGPCNRRRKREAKAARVELERNPPEPPKPAKGKSESKRKPRKAATPAPEPVAEGEPKPGPRVPGATRKRLGGIARAIAHTSISGKRADE